MHMTGASHWAFGRGILQQGVPHGVGFQGEGKRRFQGGSGRFSSPFGLLALVLISILASHGGIAGEVVVDSPIDLPTPMEVVSVEADCSHALMLWSPIWRSAPVFQQRLERQALDWRAKVLRSLGLLEAGSEGLGTTELDLMSSRFLDQTTLNGDRLYRVAFVSLKSGLAMESLWKLIPNATGQERAQLFDHRIFRLHGEDSRLSRLPLHSWEELRSLDPAQDGYSFGIEFVRDRGRFGLSSWGSNRGVSKGFLLTRDFPLVLEWEGREFPVTIEVTQSHSAFSIFEFHPGLLERMARLYLNAHRGAYQEQFRGRLRLNYEGRRVVFPGGLLYQISGEQHLGQRRTFRVSESGSSALSVSLE